MRPDIEWSEVAEGFLDIHSRLNSNTRKTLEAASFLYSLIEICSEKGLISIEELDARQAMVAQRLEAQLKRDGVGVKLQDPEYEKYSFTGIAEIDCENRVQFCRAACCKLPFALSKQDVREGIVHWDLAHPYLIDHHPDGYCVHLDRAACACTVREHRPVPCRAYDCRKETRIWLDFDNCIINPEILHPDWPFCESTAAMDAPAVNQSQLSEACHD
jgi:hypothetical protein